MLKHYTAQVCPFAHRVRLALAHKGIEHEPCEIDLTAIPDWYKELCPTGSVPMIDHDGNRIWESIIIMEYLEEVFPSQPLWDDDPFRKARGRIAVDVAGARFVSAFYRVLRGEQSDCSVEVAALESSMLGDGPFWLGPRVSLTDLAIYPWFERWCVLAHYHGVPRPDSGNIGRWIESMEGVPAVTTQRCDPQLYVQAYARYAPAQR